MTMQARAVLGSPSQLWAGIPKKAADLGKKTDLGRVKEEPDVGHGDHGEYGGREIGGSDNRPAAELAVDPHGHEQGEADADRDGPQGVEEIVAQHLPENRVCDHGGVVLETHESGGSPLPGVEKKLETNPPTMG
jgi:hypothetical protein